MTEDEYSAVYDLAAVRHARMVLASVIAVDASPVHRLLAEMEDALDAQVDATFDEGDPNAQMSSQLSDESG